MAIETINPANGKVVKKFTSLTLSEVNSKIETAQNAFFKWKETNFARRKSLLLNAADILRKGVQEYAEIMTLEMGKPISQAKAEVLKCAWVCEYYAENAESLLKKEIIETDATESYVQFDPLGIILAVMPWNFPFWQVFRFAAPALMAGNVGLLKHASNVPMCSNAIEKIFSLAEFPEGIFSSLLIGSELVSEVIKHNFVKAATLTGSDAAGRKVASECGKMLKKSVMELGGSDPFIVFSDADIDEAVSVGVFARTMNNGQSCIAAKRFIVVDDVYNEFEQKFVKAMEKLKVGDPMKEETELGPLAREDLLQELDWQVKESVKAGAKVVTGGKRIEREGSFYPATVLSNVKKGMLAYSEELFGPVAIFIRAKDESEAIKIANDSDFGLGASLWTKNTEKAKTLAAQIETGSVFINGLVKSDPRLPFGGIKMSGYGRELSHYGIKEFVNIKTVWVK